MRIRSIRPEFWSSLDVAEMDWHTRLVFVGLWSYVDDNGVGRDIERLIVTDLFPLDEDLNEASRRVHRALEHLAAHGQITRYSVDGKPYLFINAFDANQKVNRPSTPRYPLPTEGSVMTHGALTEPSVSAHEDGVLSSENPTNPSVTSEDAPFSEPSVSPHAYAPTGEGEKGRRGEGEKKTSSSSARKSATKKPASRLDPEWLPSPQTVDAMAAENPHINQQRELARFHDYYAAAPGSKGQKVDWEATYRNWIRNAADRAPRGGSDMSARERQNKSLFERTAARWGLTNPVVQPIAADPQPLAIEGVVL